jgi:hypothetical protein
MADYINIYGQDILAVASDPANPTKGTNFGIIRF